MDTEKCSPKRSTNWAEIFPAPSKPARKPAVRLTKEDWAEIYYAVESKRQAVMTGIYGKDLIKWPAHLNRIMKAIGPDGELAAEGGVEPC